MPMKKSRKAVHETAKLIKSITTIFGCLALVYVAAVNWFSDTTIGKTIASVGDTVVASERLSDFYVYYEIDEKLDLRLTEEGRFSPIGGGLPLPYSDLTIEDVLEANSTVRIRSAPTANAPIVDVLDGKTCVYILLADWELDKNQIGTATSGGWLNVDLVSC